MLFRRIILSALLVGAIAGLMVTAVQMWQVIPIIQSAEVFENGPVVSTGEEHAVNDAAVKEAAGHDHSAEDWSPADGIERSGYTLLLNILSSIGFAMLLLVAIVVSLRSNAASGLKWRHGLFWAAAGYVVFFVAPSLGLPPEIPGAEAAPLEERQYWWLFTVGITAVGLAIAVFGKSPWRWAGLVLLVVPHLIGAPHPETAMFADQPAAVALELNKLAVQFIGATSIANAALWLALGLASVWSVRRIVLPQN